MTTQTTTATMTSANLAQIREFLAAYPVLAQNFAHAVDQIDKFDKLVDSYRNAAGARPWRVAEADERQKAAWEKELDFWTRKAYGALCTADGVFSRECMCGKVFKEWLSYKRADFEPMSVSEQAIQLAKMRNCIEIAVGALDGLKIKDLHDLGLVA